ARRARAARSGVAADRGPATDAGGRAAHRCCTSAAARRCATAAATGCCTGQGPGGAGQEALMDVALWFAALCGLVVVATVATARARANPDAVIGRGAFVAAAFGHAVIIGGAIWVWGGTDASVGREAQLRHGPRVTLELRAVTLAVDRAIAIGHAATADVRMPGHGSAKVAELTRDK